MPVRLSIQITSLGHTGVTYTDRIRWMLGTTFFDLIVLLSRWETLVAPLSRRMLTTLASILQPLLIWFMLYSSNKIVFQTITTSHIRSAIAHPWEIFLFRLIQIHELFPFFWTIQTSLVKRMLTQPASLSFFTFLFFFFFFFRWRRSRIIFLYVW